MVWGGSHRPGLWPVLLLWAILEAFSATRVETYGRCEGSWSQDTASLATRRWLRSDHVQCPWPRITRSGRCLLSTGFPREHPFHDHHIWRHTNPRMWALSFLSGFVPKAGHRSPGPGAAGQVSGEAARRGRILSAVSGRRRGQARGPTVKARPTEIGRSIQVLLGPSC